MRTAPAPRIHLFVCTNTRDGSPLGPGCGARGDAIYDAMKREVGERGRVRDVWVTRTHCLGICPKLGATIACWPMASPIRADVVPEDVPALLDEVLGVGEGGDEHAASWDEIERALAASEELQTSKVLDLARRLKPGLTLEDIQNPHDFPELDDPDWHYADGVLTGMQSVASALRALKKS
jgi:(2Fe-2S) ferredoxin